jgi:hypothetical protein
MVLRGPELRDLAWRFHKKRERLQESVELRRRMIEASHANQLRAEREDIASRISRLQPGPRKVFLAQRLSRISSQ